MFHSQWKLIGLSILGLVGCSSNEDERTADVGAVVLRIAQAPEDVQCLRVTAAGVTRTVRHNVSVTPGQAVTRRLSGLPTGDVEISARAFADACSAVAADSIPTWLSDPPTQALTLRRGTSTPWSVILRPNGVLDPTVDWVDDESSAGGVGQGGGAGEAGGADNGAPQETGLVAWWPFDGSGVDASGFGNDATLNGPTPTADRFGNLEGALRFQGDSCYALAPDSDAWYFPDNFTLSLWTQLESSPGRVDLLSQTDGANPHIKWFFYLDGPTLAFHAWDETATYDMTVASDPVTIDDGAWHHLALVKQGDAYSFWFDAESVGTFEFPYPLGNSTESLSIGLSVPWDHYLDNFQGAMDDVRVYKDALSPAEIDGLYSAQAPGTGAGGAVGANGS